jgi:hypothetical protein
MSFVVDSHIVYQSLESKKITVCLTHSHSDHVRTVQKHLSNDNVTLFASPQTIDFLFANNKPNKIKAKIVPIQAWKKEQVNGVCCFDTIHAVGSYGFFIRKHGWLHVGDGRITQTWATKLKKFIGRQKVSTLVVDGLYWNLPRLIFSPVDDVVANFEHMLRELAPIQLQLHAGTVFALSLLENPHHVSISKECPPPNNLVRDLRMVGNQVTLKRHGVIKLVGNQKSNDLPSLRLSSTFFACEDELDNSTEKFGIIDQRGDIRMCFSTHASQNETVLLMETFPNVPQIVFETKKELRIFSPLVCKK